MIPQTWDLSTTQSIKTFIAAVQSNFEIVVDFPECFQDSSHFFKSDLKLIAFVKIYRVTASVFSFPMRPSSFLLPLLTLCPPQVNSGSSDFFYLLLLFLESLRAPSYSTSTLIFTNTLSPVSHYSLPLLSLFTSTVVQLLDPKPPVLFLLGRLAVSVHCILSSLTPAGLVDSLYAYPPPLTIFCSPPLIYSLSCLSRPLSQWQLLLFWRGRMQLAVGNGSHSLLEKTSDSCKGYQTELPVIRCH